MISEGSQAISHDFLAATKERVSIGPPPDWVEFCEINAEFKPIKSTPLSHLLYSRQSHAEERQHFFHQAFRLETMEAVQHQSQWRLEFEPRTQAVQIHWIRIRRDSNSFEQAVMERIQVLQREAELEGLVIDGRATILLLLEDVRVGDIVEACYTIKSQPHILSDNFASFFACPAGVALARLHFGVHFAEKRPVRWVSSDKDFTPVESATNGLRGWTWTRLKFEGAEPEPFTPAWHMDFPWVQVSDCEDWGTVARAVANAWPKIANVATLQPLLEELNTKQHDQSARAALAIQMIQDEFRYLSVNLEHGGQIPSSPETVLKRRFGDCKDLSFLLVQVLKALGLAARPILVHTGLRANLRNMLPTDAVFNHVVVEFELEGTRQWVDVTLKRQGGGALGRTLTNFALGLPVDDSVTELATQPRESVNHGEYHIEETILLDTTGAASSVAFVVTARGSEAEFLRREFQTKPLDQIEKERLQLCANRYGWAQRIGNLRQRDNREANQFCLAEVFEVTGLLRQHESPDLCFIQLPPNTIVECLPMPEDKPRRTPIGTPPVRVLSHRVEVQSIAIVTQPKRSPRISIESPHFSFNRQARMVNRCWILDLNLSFTSDAILPDELASHRKKVEEVWRESLWGLVVKAGYPSLRRRGDFGELPAEPRSAQAVPNRPQPNPMPVPGHLGPREAASQQPATQKTSPTPAFAIPETDSVSTAPRESHRRRRKNNSRDYVWTVVASILVLLTVLLIILLTRSK